jgi:hypothetical protein
MKRVSFVALALVLGFGMVFTGPAWAQEALKPPGAAKTPEAARPTNEPRPTEQPAEARLKPKGPPALLRVQIVIARYQGDKKVASLPHALVVTADDKKVLLRMGVEVPIAVTSSRNEPGATPVTSFQYRNVGTNIDCRAEERGDGLYQLTMGVENSSVYTSSQGNASGASAEVAMVGDRPMFRTFNVSLNPVLRDGQSIQTVASTDPVTGEVVKIDVTLNVVK